MAAVAEVFMGDISAAFVSQIDSAVQAKRYGRAISAMTPRNRFVHDVLVQLYDHPAMRGSWGSGHTIISRLMKFGPTGAAQAGPTAPMQLPNHLLMVREAVNHLNERMRIAVEMTYGGNHPVESIAREIHDSHAVVRNLLRDARPIMAAFMAGRGVPVPKDNC